MRFVKVNLVFIFLLIIGLFIASLYAQDEDFEEYYPLGEGSVWVYQVKSEDGLSIEEVKVGAKVHFDNIETLKTIYADGSYDCEAKGSEGVKLYKEVGIDGSYLVYTPFIILLPFSKELAKDYKFSYLSYNQKGDVLLDTSGEGTLEIKFGGKEDVTVVAGEFLNCIKILKSICWRDNNGGFEKEEYKIWFAKGVGKIKEIIEEIGYDTEDGETYTDIKECELKEAVVNGVEYGK